MTKTPNNDQIEKITDVIAAVGRIVTDANRCAKVGPDRGMSGALWAPSSSQSGSRAIELRSDETHWRIGIWGLAARGALSLPTAHKGKNLN